MTTELLEQFAPYISDLRLIPSSGGRFEVTINDTVIFSKKTLGRHARPGEVLELFQQHTGFTPIPRE